VEGRDGGGWRGFGDQGAKAGEARKGAREGRKERKKRDGEGESMKVFKERGASDKRKGVSK
jgi:hypothetical protein